MIAITVRLIKEYEHVIIFDDGEYEGEKEEVLTQSAVQAVVDQAKDAKWLTDGETYLVKTATRTDLPSSGLKLWENKFTRYWQIELKMAGEIELDYEEKKQTLTIHVRAKITDFPNALQWDYELKGWEKLSFEGRKKLMSQILTIVKEKLNG